MPEEASVISLAQLLATRPEHPVPHAGDAVHLVYAPGAGGVGVAVDADAAGVATMTVTASAAEAARSMDLARRAVVRGCGCDPDDPDGVAQARRTLGAMAFADNVNLLARQRLFSLACMQTRILPFLAPEFVPGEGPRPGSDFAFQVRFRLRPHVELSSYGPAEVELPARLEVAEEDVDARLEDMMGGRLRWGEVPEDARAGFEKLRGRVREQLASEREGAWLGTVADVCTDALADRMVREPDARYVELLRDQMANQFAANVEAEGTAWEAYIAEPTFSMEAFKAEMTANARTSLCRGLALDAVADHEGVELDEHDVLAALGPVAHGNERVAAQAMLDSGQLPQLCEVARRAKTGELVARRAVEAAAARAGAGA